MYRKFDVTGIFYLHSTFFEEVNTANVAFAQDAATLGPTSAAKNATCENIKTRDVNRSLHMFIL
jgi:hypothetical protein